MRLSRKIGITFLLIHIVAFILFVFYMHSSSDGQARLLWVLWLPIDFPVSLFVTYGFDVIPSDSEVGAFVRRWLPYFVHGVFGAIWWYFIPVFISMFNDKIKKSIKKTYSKKCSDSNQR